MRNFFFIVFHCISSHSTLLKPLLEACHMFIPSPSLTDPAPQPTQEALASRGAIQTNTGAPHLHNNHEHCTAHCTCALRTANCILHTENCTLRTSPVQRPSPPVQCRCRPSGPSPGLADDNPAAYNDDDDDDDEVHSP